MRLTLFHYPGACSQVCLFALEEAGLDYDLRLVDLSSGEQAQSAYVLVSPLGKVPALMADDAVITENAAILTFIAATAPAAGLFPKATAPLDLARRQAGLSFCGGTLHPIVRGIANPGRITEGDGGPVRAKSLALAAKSFGFAEALLNDAGWWLGEWSLIDVYLNWAVSTAQRAGMDMTMFPRLTTLQDRLMERPGFRRMLEREARAVGDLAARRDA